MGFKIATSFLSYTPTGSTEATAHPDDNVALITRPRLTWRTTSAGGTLSLGGSGTPTALILNKANFATVDVTAGSFTASGVAVPVQKLTGRRKLWLTLTSASFPVVLTPHTPDGGASYFELGVAALPTGIVEVEDFPVYPRLVPHRARTVTPFLGGGREVNIDGLEMGVTWTISPEFWLKIATNYDPLVDLNRATGPIALFENLGAPEDVYIFDKTEDFGIARNLKTFAAEVTLEEAI